MLDLSRIQPILLRLSRGVRQNSARVQSKGTYIRPDGIL